MNTETAESDFFVMKPTDNAKNALSKWLQRKTFDSYTHGWKDKKGNEGIGLLRSTSRGNNAKAGVIICLDQTLDTAIEIIEKHLRGGSNV